MLLNYSENFENALAGMMPGTTTGGRVVACVVGLYSVPQYWTVTIPSTPVDNTKYIIALDDATASYTTGEGETQEQLRDGLIGQLRINPGVMSFASLDYTATTIILKTNRYFYSDRILNLDSNLLTVTETAATTASPISFGRMVAKTAVETNPKFVKLPTSLTDVITGCSLMNQAKEAEGIGLDRMTHYRDKQTVDVVERTDNSGIYIQSLVDMTINDNIHVSIAPGSEGKITSSSTGTIDVSSIARVLKPTYTSSRDGKITLISFNRP